MFPDLGCIDLGCPLLIPLYLFAFNTDVKKHAN